MQEAIRITLTYGNANHLRNLRSFAPARQGLGSKTTLPRHSKIYENLGVFAETAQVLAEGGVGN